MKTLQYWGSGNIHEGNITGNQRLWYTGMTCDVTDADAATLQAYSSDFRLDQKEDIKKDNVVTAETNPVTGGIELSSGGVQIPIIVAGLKSTNTGAQNVLALQSAHDALSGTGGIILMPSGEFNLDGTITLSSGWIGPLGAQNIVFRGAGWATRLIQQTAGISTFSKAAGHAHGFESFALIGPGTGNANSVGIEWLNSAGGSCWRDLWITNFGYGARFIDATSMTFINCHFHANGVNIGLGYNCDVFQFFGGRLQNAVTVGMEIGYRDAAHSSGSLQCNPVKVVGVRFGAQPLAINIPDYGASNIEFDSCYFENNQQIATIGDVAQANGAYHVQFSNCYFTFVGAGGSLTQIVSNVNANQSSTLTLKHSRSDTVTFSGRWVDLGLNGRLEINDCTLPSTGTHVYWNGFNYTVGSRNFIIGRGRQEVFDGSVLGSVIPYDVSMTTGTGKTFGKFRRTNAATGADLGILSAQIKDINGQFAAWSGGVMFDQPTGGLPTAAVAYRGMTVIQQGGAGAADTIVCCMKSAADTYSWKVVSTG